MGPKIATDYEGRSIETTTVLWVLDGSEEGMDRRGQEPEEDNSAIVTRWEAGRKKMRTTMLGMQHGIDESIVGTKVRENVICIATVLIGYLLENFN